MKRRDLLVDGVRFSGTLFAWSLLARGRVWAEKESGVWPYEIHQPPVGLHYSLNILAAYLHGCKMTEDLWPSASSWKVVYERLEWSMSWSNLYGDSGRVYFANRPAGAFSIARVEGKRPSGQIHYELKSNLDLDGLRQDCVEVSLFCLADRIRSACEWDAGFYQTVAGHPVPDTLLKESGRVENGRISLEPYYPQKRSVRTAESLHPVVFRSLLPEVVRGLPRSPGEAVEFDMIRDGGVIVPGQRLAYAGEIYAQVGATVKSLHGYVLLGKGVQPSHYWVDEASRPILITQGTIGYGLREIQGGADI